MRIWKTVHRFLALVLLLTLTSCGGGTGGSLAEGGIGGTGISTGPITGFGSIYVNGVEYDTQTAEVIIEGDVAGTGDAIVLNNLAVGKVVTVEGSIPTGTRATATRVYFNDNVEGPLQAIAVIDADTRELTVLGQTVIADADTRFEDTTLGALAVNNQLEVSGLIQPNGAIKATFIEKKSAVFVDGSAVEVKGVVSNLNTLARTFTLSAAAVDYSGADTSELDSALAEGDSVEVKGVFSGGVLYATRIETEDDLNISDSTAWLEIEGYISSVASSSEFVLDGVTTRITSSTRFEGGSVSDVLAGAHVEVEGTYSGGVLSAAQISFYDDVAIEAKVDSVGANSLTLVGVAGLTVTVNALTEIDGAVSTFAAITSGRLVKVVGNWSAGSNTVIASKIEVENPSSTIEIKLRGLIAAANNPFITVAGTTVDTTGASYRSATGESLSAAQFFAQAGVGDRVHLEGRQSNATNVLTWTRISLRGEDD